MSTNITRCTRCILPSTFPSIKFDADGVCNYCRKAPDEAQLAIERDNLRERMEAAIERTRGQGEYDCIVAFSGGKDSSYTLMRLVQHYNLRCLAVTIDNGFISEQARQNCYAVTDALGVDFQFFRPAPDFMMNMYRQSVTTGGVQTRASVKRASAICNSCISLINNLMIKFAVQYEAPIIAGGYIGGQVPKNMAVLDLDLIHQNKMRDPMRGKYNQLFGPSSEQFFFIRESLLRKQPENRVMVINPMLTVAVTEEEIIEAIGTLGWKQTKDTGKNSSNCQLNDLGIAIHYRKHQFHPYALEISEQVRHGLMTREHAMAKVGEIPQFIDLAPQMAKVGLNDVAELV